MSMSIDAFKEKLESQHTFPGPYIFKFIVPIEKKDELLKIIPSGQVSERMSKTNKYISLTVRATMDSSEEVVQVYQTAQKIEGIIAL